MHDHVRIVHRGFNDVASQILVRSEERSDGGEIFLILLMQERHGVSDVLKKDLDLAGCDDARIVRRRFPFHVDDVLSFRVRGKLRGAHVAGNEEDDLPFFQERSDPFRKIAVLQALRQHHDCFRAFKPLLQISRDHVRLHRKLPVAVRRVQAADLTGFQQILKIIIVQTV